MRKPFIYLVACALLSAAFSYAVKGGEKKEGSVTLAALKPEIAALVNGEPITKDEFINELVLRYGDEVFNAMVSRTIIQQEIKKNRDLVLDRDVKKLIESNKKQIAKELRRRKMTMAEYREKVLVPRAFLKSLWLLKNPVDDAILLKFFTAHGERYEGIERIKFAYIYTASINARTRTLDRARALRRIEAAKKELDGGAAFRDVARKYSDHRNSGLAGTRPLLAKKDLRRTELAIFPAATALKAGGVSAIVETGTGFYVLKLLQHVKKKKVDYETIKDRLKEDFVQEALSREGHLLVEELKKKADIKINRTLFRANRKLPGLQGDR